MNSKISLKPKKSLGQHFLHSPSALKKIVDAAKIAPDETVLEIGPGTGILTAALLATGAKVVAIEKDERAYEVLTQKFAQEIAEGRLSLIIGDILENEIEQKDNLKIKNGVYALVANIPYYITGAILEKFLEHEPRPNRMVLLVQKEVAERIVARDKKESVLSISVKAFGSPKMVAVVPRGAFVPAPTVDSAILMVDGISGSRFDSTANISHFFKVVRAGFAHKRKYACKNLETSGVLEKPDKSDGKSIENVWSDLKISEKIRAEDMSVEQWVEISSRI